MSPFFQRPLELGADIVVHSTTKFLNGHSDSVGGVAVVKDAAHAEWLQYYQNAAGAILSPVRLLARAARHQDPRPAHAAPRGERRGASRAFLREQRKVRKVYWPGFPDHPGHEVHKRQASGFGAMISFDLGDREAAERLPAAVRLCSLGESLGGIETLISHPATMTHAGYTQAERDALGIGDGLVRISVGCEDAEDLIADLAARAATRSERRAVQRTLVVQPGQVGRVAAAIGQRQHLGHLVRVERRRSACRERLEALAAGLDDEQALLVPLAPRPSSGRSRRTPGTTLTQAARPPLHQGARDALRVLGRRPPWRATPGRPLTRALLASSAFHCAFVSGTTESRPWRTAGCPRRRAAP